MGYRYSSFTCFSRTSGLIACQHKLLLFEPSAFKSWFIWPRSGQVKNFQMPAEIFRLHVRSFGQLQVSCTSIQNFICLLPGCHQPYIFRCVACGRIDMITTAFKGRASRLWATDIQFHRLAMQSCWDVCLHYAFSVVACSSVSTLIACELWFSQCLLGLSEACLFTSYLILSRWIRDIPTSPILKPASNVDN